MDRMARALLRRVRITVADAAVGRCHVDLDGWPLLAFDRQAGRVAVNDLRSSAQFAHSAFLPPVTGLLTVRAGAVGEELYLLMGDLAAVFVVPEFHLGTNAEVRVVESATGRLLLERTVRYRLLPAGMVPASPACLDGRG